MFTKALLRFASVDSRRFITFLIRLFTENQTTFTEEEIRMLQMFHYTIWQKSMQDSGFSSLLDSVNFLKKAPKMQNELLELLAHNYNSIDFIDQPVNLGFPCPLDLHCTYSRDQLLVAMDFMKPSTVREGVKFISEKNLDIFFITLNKSDKDYSPTTMYHDYSINDVLFHWQSQSTTSETSTTGLRYRKHRENGHRILLFVREFKEDKLSKIASPYTFLGLADYVSHQGSRPMNITWKLEQPIPAKFLKKTNKLVVN